jgi:hypothetical protein
LLPLVVSRPYDTFAVRTINMCRGKLSLPAVVVNENQVIVNGPEINRFHSFPIVPHNPEVSSNSNRHNTNNNNNNDLSPPSMLTESERAAAIDREHHLVLHRDGMLFVPLCCLSLCFDPILLFFYLLLPL